MKKIISLLFFILMLDVIIVPVFAHPGRTNPDGGHTDRSTGEYHYHHGYSAHDHYDMDGDGDLDCPHNFNDQTGINSGISSDSGIPYDNIEDIRGNITPLVTDPPMSKENDIVIATDPVDSPISTEKEDRTMPIWLFICLIAIIVFMFFMIRSKNQEIENIKRKNTEDLEHEKEKTLEKIRTIEEDCENRISSERQRLTNSTQEFKSKLHYKDTCILTLSDEIDVLRSQLHSVISAVSSGARYYPTEPLTEVPLYAIAIPDDVYFNDNNIPVKGIISERYPYGDYTVFVAPVGKVYHSDYCCSASMNLKVAHIFDVVSNRRPCVKCGEYFSKIPPEWYEEVMKLNAAKK